MCVQYYSDKSQFSLFLFRDFIECSKKGKSNVQVDPSLHCLHTTERPFSRHTIYIRMQVSKGASSR